MRANSPSALFASFSLHAAFAAAVLALTFWAAKHQAEAPVIFELVAGEPTAPDELVAPAKGNTGLKVDIPKPQPVREIEPQPETVESPVAPPPEAKKPAESKPKPEPKRMSYQEFQKQHGAPKETKATPPKQTRAPRIDTEGISGGVTGGSTTNKRGGGGGTALARQEQGQLETYIAQLMGALRRAHEKPPRLGDQLEARITFSVAPNGDISGVRLSRSSGNEEFDQSALAAFQHVAGIGPTPTAQAYTWTVTFRMKEEG
jgi:colicin import membrane protein